MKPNKVKQTEYLFAQIGTINDRFLDEAIHYRPRKAAFPRVLMVAACLGLAGAMLFSVFVIASLQTGKDNASDSLPHYSTLPNVQNTPPEHESGSLQQLLLNCREDSSAAITVLEQQDANALISVSGARVLWRYGDSSTVYMSRALGERELKKLLGAVPKGERVGEDSQQPAVQVWILLDDGTVFSPYLPLHAGNMGACRLFDYNVEIIPNSDFTSCLSEILY